MAASRNCVDSMNILLRAGINLDAVDKNGRTPLLDAVLHRHIDAVEYLVEAGAGVHHGFFRIFV